jgi:signal transduction histidine kinase/CheY-like chemotaxis protein
MIPLVVLFGSASAVSVAIGSALIVGLIVLRLLVEGRRFARFSEEVSAQAQVAERLRHAQKMEALGRLAGGVAHDFNNLLTAIGGYADMLVEQLAGNRELRAEAEEIRRASDRAADLTRQLLAFSRHHVDPELPARIDEVVAETERLLRRLIGERHRLLVALGAPGSVVRVGSTTLEQIVVNLVLNARDAMPDGGTITIETAPVTVGADAPGVRLRVVDSGHGIDPAIVDRIFEPFFTTKDSSAGTGLGLAIVYAAVDDSGGTIEVESEPGRGTRFEVALPLAVASATTGAGEPARATHARAAAARILVAEDEPAIRSLMVSVLRAAGHVVFEAANGQDAIELTATLDRPPDLLVSDVIMPDVGGLELARVLRERWSRLPILFVSGYTDELLSTADLRSLGAGFLEKPFSAAAFRDEVDRLVGSTVAQPASASSATISS